MFGKLKEKLKNWTKSLVKKAEEKEEIIGETKEDRSAEEKKKEVLEKIKEASDIKPKEIEKFSESKIEKIEEAASPEKIIEAPVKFEVGLEKYTPDLEKIEEIEKELEETKEGLEKKKVELDKQQPKHEGEKKGFFQRLTSKLTKIKITEKEFEVYGEELRMLLLENNVAYEVADKIITKLKREIVGKEILKKEVEVQIEDTLKDIIIDILIEPYNIADEIKMKDKKPYVILFCGINGTGKTTTIAKIANHLKKKGISSVLAAADTFRAASIEQINKHAEKLNLKVISHDYGSDPAAVAFDAIKYAEKNKIDCVLIDTAGRMHSEKNLLKELEKISRVSKPDLKIFVGEAITGNDSIEQIRSFDFAIGIDGIILTKADTDEKGGTALSVGYVTKKPILYLGTGQEYDAIIPFNKNKFVEELGL